MTIERRRRIIRAQRRGTGVALVAAISYIAGMTDAIGLRLSGDFVSFMTGNTTRSAIALADGDTNHALVLLGAILVFVAGNAVGVIIGYLADRRIFAVLASVSMLLFVAAILNAPEEHYPRFYLVVLAMGLVNAAIEHIEGLPIGLTYVTGALSRFGRGLGRFILGDRQFDWNIQAVPWIGMVTGALTGAILGLAFPDLALFVAALLTLCVALSTLFLRRALHRRYNQRITRVPQQR